MLETQTPDTLIPTESHREGRGSNTAVTSLGGSTLGRLGKPGLGMPPPAGVLLALGLLHPSRCFILLEIWAELDLHPAFQSPGNSSRKAGGKRALSHPRLNRESLVLEAALVGGGGCRGAQSQGSRGAQVQILERSWSGQPSGCPKPGLQVLLQVPQLPGCQLSRPANFSITWELAGSGAHARRDPLNQNLHLT